MPSDASSNVNRVVMPRASSTSHKSTLGVVAEAMVEEDFRSNSEKQLSYAGEQSAADTECENG